MQSEIRIEHEPRFEHFERSRVPTADELFSILRETTGRSAIDETKRVRSKTHEIDLRVVLRELCAKLGELGRPKKKLRRTKIVFYLASRLWP
jgi:hypothetical protein